MCETAQALKRAVKQVEAMRILRCRRALTERRFHRTGTEDRPPVHVLNWTARIARAAHTDGVSDKNPESLSKMKAGDILVSHPTAVREHEISVIPNAPHAMSPTHDEAVSDGRSEADVLGVDAWLTEDHTHVMKIASHRAPDK
jgi:hypothetical protein